MRAGEILEPLREIVPIGTIPETVIREVAVYDPPVALISEDGVDRIGTE
jgi:hypothetical protein